VWEFRFRGIYAVLLPAIITAGGVLSYYTYQTAAQFERLGEKSIAQSILLLLEDKLSRLEQLIISADNATFALVDLSDRSALVDQWRAEAERASPSVRAVVVVDKRRRVIGMEARASKADANAFRSVFTRRILPDLELDNLAVGRLKHLHADYGGRSYLISYKAVEHDDDVYYLAAHHDTGYLVRDVFPELFRGESGNQIYNVVDDENRLVFGPSLVHSGDYVVGRRFPTTLYGWRVQVAPQEAPLLKEKGRARSANQAALIGLSLAIILLGVGFLLFAADKDRRLNALKSEFIANVSHELKTPLSVVRMYAEMLLTKRVPDETKQQRYLETICTESERLTGLIENVLDFAALERGKRRYQMHEGSLASVVERAVETFRHRFEYTNLSVTLSVEDSVPNVRMDEQAIMLAAINLLDNAVKYGEGTPITVSVTVEKRDVVVSVRDRGPGIPTQDLKRVFERFYRTNRSQQTRGSGIGLALVRHIAEDHSGRAWAENAPDEGAIVRFAVPYPRV